MDDAAEPVEPPKPEDAGTPEPGDDGRSDTNSGHRDEARPLVRIALIATVLTVLTAASSVALRSGDGPPESSLTILSVTLAVTAVISLLVAVGAIVLWILVRVTS